MSLSLLIGFSFLVALLYWFAPVRFKWVLLLCASLLFYAHVGRAGLVFLLFTAFFPMPNDLIMIDLV